ncbi:MAG TPA: hypothetical protein VGF14_07610 [Alphaproteobacteria bacterium]
MSAQQMTAGENNIYLYQGEVDAYTTHRDYLTNSQFTQPQQQQAQMDSTTAHRNMMAWLEQQQDANQIMIETEMRKKQLNDYKCWQAAAAANDCTP